MEKFGKNFKILYKTDRLIKLVWKILWNTNEISWNILYKNFNNSYKECGTMLWFLWLNLKLTLGKFRKFKEIINIYSYYKFRFLCFMKNYKIFSIIVTDEENN